MRRKLNIIYHSILWLVIIGITGSIAYEHYYVTPCTRTLHYSIGEFDERFNLSKVEFISVIAEAEAIWEDAFGYDFFTYDAEATFPVHLKYDDRQQLTDEATEARIQLEARLQSQEQRVAQHAAEIAQHEAQLRDYQQVVARYETKLQAYNTEVADWNNRGGAPPKEYRILQQTKHSLEIDLQNIRALEDELYASAQAINVTVDENNSLIRDYNLDVQTFNSLYGSSRRFDQADYRGTEINVYQFETVEDLRLALAHELGHALGIDHVAGESSIMYYLMGEQDLSQPKPSSDDSAALRKICRLD